MSFIDALSATITPALQYRTGQMQGQQQKEEKEQAGFLGQLKLMRQQQENALNDRLRTAQIERAERENKAAGQPAPDKWEVRETDQGLARVNPRTGSVEYLTSEEPYTGVVPPEQGQGPQDPAAPPRRSIVQPPKKSLPGRNIDPLSAQGIEAAVDRERRLRATKGTGGTRGTGGGRPPTEGQRKAQSLLMMAEQANGLLRGFGGGKEAPGWLDRQKGRVGMDVGNMMTSDEYQRMQQAALQLSDAWLRYTSGAAVPESEVERFAKSFLPLPGDSPANLAQKAQAREQILRAMRQGAGSQTTETAAQIGPDLEGYD